MLVQIETLRDAKTVKEQLELAGWRISDENGGRFTAGHDKIINCLGSA
jgi:hypothetical protein